MASDSLRKPEVVVVVAVAMVVVVRVPPPRDDEVPGCVSVPSCVGWLAVGVSASDPDEDGALVEAVAASILTLSCKDAQTFH